MSAYDRILDDEEPLTEDGPGVARPAWVRLRTEVVDLLGRIGQVCSVSFPTGRSDRFTHATVRTSDGGRHDHTAEEFLKVWVPRVGTVYQRLV